jgi:gamma-glutamylcyclotransferase (GGCT)/AIG2-like uncharacterized protein YtfP
MQSECMNQLFVYGSLRSGFHSQAYSYISSYFTFVGSAKVRGKLFDLGEYPAGIKSNDDSFIVGELYRITNESETDWAFAQLDDYEGVFVEPGETALYKREIADIHIDNTITKAWVYWYNADITGKPVVASGDILEYIQNKSAKK